MNKHKVLVIVISLINVVLAVGKDSFLAGYLGTSSEADAFFLAFFIPDMLGNNLIASAFGIAAAPILVQALKQTDGQFIKSVFIKMQRLAFMIAVFFTIMILTLGHGMIARLGAGFNSETSKTAMVLLYILSPTICIYPLVSVRVMMLQVKGKFGLASMTALFLNVVLMGSVLGLRFFNIPKDEGVFWLVGAIVVAVIMQLLYLKAVLIEKSHKNSSNLDNKNSTAEIANNMEPSFLRPFATVLLLLFLSQMLLYYERFLGSSMDSGSVAAISYAYRISQFSILVFSYSIAFVVYPKLIDLLECGKSDEARKLYQDSFREILFFSMPVAIGLCILREPVIRILFAHYSFDNTSVVMSSKVLMGYGLSVVGQGLVFMNLRLLAAFKYLRYQVLGMFLLVLLTMGVENILVTYFGLTGIGVGAFLGSLAGAIVTTGFIFYRLKVNIREEILHITKLFIGNLPALCIALLLSNYWKLNYLNLTVGEMFVFGVISGMLVLSTSYIGVKGIQRI